MFITMMVFFFIWLVSQISDLGTVFGFRTSHTVANDVANLMTSLSATPSDVTHVYSVKPGATTTAPFNYEMTFSSGIVCVTSFRETKAASTTDCVSHPYCFDRTERFESERGAMELTFVKKIADGEKYSCMTVSAGLKSVSGCNEKCQR